MVKQTSRFSMAIKSSAVTLGISTGVLAILYRFYPSDWLLSAAITAGTTFYHFAMRLLVGTIVPRCVRNPEGNPWFRPRAFETKLYKALRVKLWKDRMPTYDPASFSLQHNSLEQIVYNSCVSEAVHAVIVLFSFVPILFSLWWGALPVFLTTSILAALFDSCFVMMQRYNRPRLVRILRKKEASGL